MIGTLRYGQNRYTEVSKVAGEETEATGNMREDSSSSGEVVPSDT